MKVKYFMLAGIFISLFFLVSCFGGGNKDTNQPPTKDEIEKLLTSASSKMGSGNIASSCEEYASILTKDSQNSEARFGHALCSLIMLMERNPVTSILMGFGQDGVWNSSTVFGDTGYLNTDLKNELPFSNLASCVKTYGWWLSPKHRELRCMLGNSASNFSVNDFTGYLVALEPYIDSIIADLLVAIGDSGATYTISKELYNGDADIPVNHADMVQILAGMYFAKAGIDMAASWNFDITPAELYNSNGDFAVSKSEFVEMLNSSFVLKSNNFLSSAKSNLIDAFAYSESALFEVLSGAQNGILDLSSENQPIFQELYEFATSGAGSVANGETAIPNIFPSLSVNLKLFLDSPFTANVDPFVLEGNKIKPVEAFWKPVIEKYTDIDMDNIPKYKVFSNTVKNIQHPYRKLFDEIIGHKFGVDHYAGKPL